jgi:hypothetical protein
LLSSFFSTATQTPSISSTETFLFRDFQQAPCGTALLLCQYRTIHIVAAHFSLNSCFPFCLHFQKLPFNRHQFKLVLVLHFPNQEECAIKTLVCVVLVRYVLSVCYLVSEDKLLESRRQNRTS